uniref:Dpy-19 like C-mannosyltransferase 3 n=1 Tax=Eptatretus burgeri TaxID=7764 RepID=A0A8C4R3F4_EPTBU
MIGEGEIRSEVKTIATSASCLGNVLVMIGVILGLLAGVVHVIYLGTLHENELWFSNIQEVEREISFRTECGLYYSYYKQLLQAPSFSQGVLDLVYDNNTESMRTINVLKRMNIYQEVIMAGLFRVLPVQHWLEPVYFYIYTVFALQGVYIFALYMISWMLSGSWLAGLLAAAWFMANRLDTSRVEFTIPLRESWALPFLACQLAVLTYYFKHTLRPIHETCCHILLYLFTFSFCLCWQFNQFVMLIQAMALYSCFCLNLLPQTKVFRVFTAQAISLMLVAVLQFFNSMLLGSLALSFILAAHIVHFIPTPAFLVLPLKIFNLGASGVSPEPKTEVSDSSQTTQSSILWRLVSFCLHLVVITTLTVLLNCAVKMLLVVESDEHIFKFLMAKFGLSSTRDIDAKLYLCEKAFGWLPLDTFERLSGTAFFPTYAVAFTICFFTTTSQFIQTLKGHFYSAQGSKASLKWDGEQSLVWQSSKNYHFIHSFWFGLLALSTMRMKYLWTSHMCTLSAAVICDVAIWGALFRALRFSSPRLVTITRHLVPLLLLSFLAVKRLPVALTELEELREFHDPDTVDLMNWIRQETRPKAVFAGSMQLLAGVKLCTGRIPTNHPHYENKALRERTHQVYQVYARNTPSTVHGILRSVGADYLILEDSICYERWHERGCRLRDLLDVANGQVMDGEGENAPDLVTVTQGRFCHEIKTGSSTYTKYFHRVFINKTFHVYQLRND